MSPYLECPVLGGINMETYQIISIIGVIIFIYFIFFKNRRSAQKEISSLNEIEYIGSSTMKFDDVAGNYEAKQSLLELVDFIQNPEKYSKFNVRMPKGILLYGEPGTGKTLNGKGLGWRSRGTFLCSIGF
jgi:cell division protease FtsH